MQRPAACRTASRRSPGCRRSRANRHTP